MRLAPDASAAVKWAITEPDSAAANRLLNGELELYAPRLLASEVGNALWRRTRSNELERQSSLTEAGGLVGLPLNWANDAELITPALDIALALNRPICDCVYPTLAYRVDAALITADARFYNTLAATEHSGRAALLARFAPAR